MVWASALQVKEPAPSILQTAFPMLLVENEFADLKKRGWTNMEPSMKATNLPWSRLPAAFSVNREASAWFRAVKSTNEYPWLGVEIWPKIWLPGWPGNIAWM